MSGRRRTTFAVDREPVLAWKVPTFHGGAPYADMPAAAAVSPVVPPGADPYGRCWPNHVDASCLPYIGTLYSSSLPPSYRVQPCVSSLGQIWPPTPPPDGCSRHDAASNSFYFCPPMSPMFVHGDSISQSIGSALPRVGHYSQLTEPNIESTLHSSGYQIESPKNTTPHLNAGCRTIPKCKSSNSAHPYDSTKKKPDLVFMSQGIANTEKSVLNVHHSLCACASCSGKYFSDLTRGSDKENIHDSALHNSFHSDLKQASDKMKQKVCDANKSENWNFLQFRGTNQEIPFDKCSCSIQGQCVIQPNYYKENKLSYASVKIPAKDTYKKPLNFPMSNTDVMYNYSCNESRRPNSSVCTSSSPYPVMTAPPTLSSPSTSTSVRNVYPSETYPVASVVSTPARDVYSIPLHLQMNGDTPSYNKSCCFSPPYPRARTLYHNASPETEQSNQKQNSVVICGNNVNASPLKNVYFSHLESENINFDIHKSHQGSEHPSSLTADTANIAYATINANSSDLCNPYAAATADYTKNQQKMTSSLSSTPKLPRRKREDIEFIGEKKKVQRSQVKRERESADCEFQKSLKRPAFDYCSEMTNTPTVLNLSTLGTWHKTELTGPGCNSVTICKDSQTLHTSLPPELSLHVQSKKHNDSHEETPLMDVKTPKQDLFQHIKPVPVCNEMASAAAAFNDMLCSHMLRAFDENSSAPQTVSSDKKQASGNVCEKMDSKTFSDSVETMLLPEDQDVKRDIRVSSPVDASDKGIKCPVAKFQAVEFENSPILLDQVDSKCNQKECDTSQCSTEDSLERPIIVSEKQSDSSDDAKEGTSENVGLNLEATPVFSDSSQIPPPDFNSDEHEIKSSKGKDQQNSPGSLCNEERTSPPVYSMHDADIVCQNDGKMTENQLLESDVSSNNAAVLYDSSKNCHAQNDNEMPLSPAVEAKVNTNESGPISDARDIKAEISLEHQSDYPEKQEENKADSFNFQQSSVEFDEFHGLHLLLDGIAQREKDHNTCDLIACGDDLASNNGGIVNENSEEVLEVSSIATNSTNLDNLSMLCACAEHLAIKCCGSAKSDEETVQNHKSPDINSNYPSIKLEGENLKSCARGEHPFNNSAAEVELEMRRKLAELQKKYKAKQKELARLKSRKVSSKKSVKRSSAESSKSLSVPHCKLEPEDASCSLRDDSSVIGSSFNCPDRLHSTFNKCDLKNFEDFVSNELSSMVVQCAGDVCNDSSSQMYSVPKFTSNNLPAERTPVTETKETNCGQDGEQATIATLKENQQNISPSKHSSNKSVTNVLPNSQKEKSKRNGAYSGDKIFPVQSMSLRSRTKRNLSCGFMQKRKVPKISEVEMSQSSSESPEEYSPKKLRSSESGKETALSSDECSAAVLNQKTLSSKRKADSPRKYSPLKQGNLTETIVTKQLRSRILISEELSELSEANDEQDDSDYVTEELFDALRKCHLSESPQRTNASGETAKKSRNIFAEEKQYRVLPKHLVDKQRVLATEDGLFYAGYIKPIEPPDVYGIVLDGERGTKPHVFSLEEILSDTILEVKPQSVLELPLGTRVCAYWSQQYRCLYPGCVAKLTSKPKLVSSESCVFVEFDDGDSGQIPIKDIRLLPPDMLKDNHEDTAEDNSVRHEKVIDLKKGTHNGKMKLQKKHSKSSKKELRTTMKKASIPAGEENVLPSQCDPSSDLNVSSQITGTKPPGENLDFRLCHSGSLEKHPKRHCKSKSSSKDKPKGDAPLDEKSKKRRKYKEHHKHHRHHHRHHHHHHRHCRRHHHCKKHKHKKSITVNIVTPPQDQFSASIPSSSIPDCNSPSKNLQNSRQQVKGCNECDVHSTSKELPQDSRHIAAFQPTGGKVASRKQVLKTRRSLHPFLTRSRKSIRRSGLPFCTR